jgi:hypothetical protein
MYSNGVHIFYICLLRDFAYIIGLMFIKYIIAKRITLHIKEIIFPCAGISLNIYLYQKLLQIKALKS